MAGRKRQWLNLHHQVAKDLKSLPFLRGSHFIVCCSGGLDSVALLYLLLDLSSSLSLQLEILHFHHGGEVPYRNHAKEFVTQIGIELNLPIHIFSSNIHLKTEQEMRHFRRIHALSHVQLRSNELNKKVYLVTAHHQDDLLETQLMRLVRGTGLQGLKSMPLFLDPWLRPLLGQRKSDLQDFCSRRNIRFLEDPSNLDTSYFRNWMRHDWLIRLEKKQPGALNRLALSLKLILNQTRCPLPRIHAGDRDAVIFISRREYLALTQQDKGRCVAAMLMRLQIRDYSQGHIAEILKQLHSLTGSQKLSLANCEWSWHQTWLYARNLKKR